VLHSRLGNFAVRPGSDFSSYPEIQIEPLAIRYGDKPPTSSVHPRASDFQLSEKDRAYFERTFREVFSAELKARGGKQVVDAPGKRTLLLRPRVQDLRLSAPVKITRDPDLTFVEYSGELRFEGEVIDGQTGEVLARFSDRRKIGYDQAPDEVKNYDGVVFWYDLRLVFRSLARSLSFRLAEPPLS